jgi:hypothetical protein
VCKYEGGIYDGILSQENGDFCILNESDVAKLEEGLLRYTLKYEFYTSSPELKDGIYSRQEELETDIYLDISKNHIPHVC